MVENTHRRQEIMNQMDQILKSDNFYFLNTSELNSAIPKKSNRSKTSSHRVHPETSTNNGYSRGRQTNRFDSTRSKEKHFLNFTGINTYMYEVLHEPMKESFHNSIQKRKRVLNNSIKE